MPKISQFKSGDVGEGDKARRVLRCCALCAIPIAKGGEGKSKGIEPKERKQVVGSYLVFAKMND